VPLLLGSSARMPVARPQCRIDRTIFLPTPSVTMALSFVNTSGSWLTASTAFFSQECRNTNVSWPENERRGPWLGVFSLRGLVSLISYPEWQFELPALQLRQQPFHGEPDDGGFPDVPLLRSGVQAVVQGLVQIKRDGNARPIGFRACSFTVSRLSHGRSSVQVMTRKCSYVNSPQINRFRAAERSHYSSLRTCRVQSLNGPKSRCARNRHSSIKTKIPEMFGRIPPVGGTGLYSRPSARSPSLRLTMVRRSRGGAQSRPFGDNPFRGKAEFKTVAKGRRPSRAQGFGPGFPSLPRPAFF